jgi:flagellar biogenesis protein FliO
MKRACWALTLFLSSLAQAQAQAPAMPDDSGPSLGWMLLRTLVVLALVVALIYLTLNWGLRKLMGVKGMPGAGSGVVKVMERIPLDPKRALFVFQVADEYLLLGGGEGAVSLLAKIDRETMDKLKAERAAKPPALSPFLLKLLSRRGGGSPPPSV